MRYGSLLLTLDGLDSLWNPVSNDGFKMRSLCGCASISLLTLTITLISSCAPFVDVLLFSAAIILAARTLIVRGNVAAAVTPPATSSPN